MAAFCYAKATYILFRQGNLACLRYFFIGLGILFHQGNLAYLRYFFIGLGILFHQGNLACLRYFFIGEEGKVA